MRSYHPLQPPKIQKDTIVAGYNYKEYAPSDRLKRYVACYWIVDICASDTGIEHRIIPDGCLDIIIDLRAASLSKAAFITGFMPGYEVIHPVDDCSLFGIRFYLESVHRVLKQPASAFMDRRVFLEDVWGTEGRLWPEQIISAGGAAADIIPIIESKLNLLFGGNESRMDAAVQTGMEYMYAFRGNLSVRR